MSRYKNRRYPQPDQTDIVAVRSQRHNPGSPRYWFHELGINQLISKLEGLDSKLNRSDSKQDIVAIVALLQAIAQREAAYHRVGGQSPRYVSIDMKINGTSIQDVDLKELAGKGSRIII